MDKYFFNRQRGFLDQVFRIREKVEASPENISVIKGRSPGRARQSERGFLLIMTYMLITSLSIFSIALFGRGSSFLQTAERNKKKIVAFQMAEAGFDDAFQRLRANTLSSYPWQSGYVSLSTGNIEGGYTVTVTDMGNNIRQISATGYSPGQNTTTESQETRSVTGFSQTAPSSAFNFAVFAVNSVQVSGNAMTDSYDSRLNGGVYGGSNVAQNGHLGTDAASAGMVMMSGNVEIRGNAVVGPNGNPGPGVGSVITTSGNVSITGSRTAATAAQNPQTLSTSVGTEGALSVSGNTDYTLTAGVHRFSSLSVSGNGSITALGPVQIYVDGAVSISGNGISTASNLPPNMVIYSMGTSSISLSGNANFFGGIYAPRSNVSVTGNGHVYGALVSKDYQQSGNGQVHFDEALRDVAGSGGNQLELLSWRENNVTAQSASSGTTYG